MFFIYQLTILIIILFLPIIIIVRIFKNKENINSFKEKIGVISKVRKKGTLVWFHCASVGELMSIIPLIKHYENKSFIKQILITTNTLSSTNIFYKYKFKKTVHQFFPIDFIFISKKFLNYWRPQIAIFVESEIWPSFFKELNKKDIPLILLNARITKKTFNKWYKFHDFSNSVFKNISASYPQNIETFNYLKKLNVKKIRYLGNLKYVENLIDKKNSIEKKLIVKFKNFKTWIAASTHAGEEIVCAKSHIILKKKIDNLITIIIPRHIHRVNEIISKIENLNLKVTLYSSKNIDLNDTDIYIVDAYGVSKDFYKISNTVFLGGSLSNKGGQNPIEPARLGAQILHGKNIYNFKDVYKHLNILKISKKIKNENDIASSIIFSSLKKNKSRIKKVGEEIFKKTTTELDQLIKNEF